MKHVIKLSSLGRTLSKESMKHREAKKTTDLDKMLPKLGIYGIVEYKQTTSNRIRITDFQPHQIPSLEAFQQSGLVWKLSDSDPRQKPGDTISIPPGMTSWVGLIYDDCCCFVFIDRILNLKSITKEQAKELATYIVKV